MLPRDTPSQFKPAPAHGGPFAVRWASDHKGTEPVIVQGKDIRKVLTVQARGGVSTGAWVFGKGW